MARLESETAELDRLTMTERVVAEVARAEDVSPTDLDPLQSVIDPDALDQLFDPVANSPRMAGQLSFSYHGYEVTAHADGYIQLTSQSE